MASVDGGGRGRGCEKRSLHRLALSAVLCCSVRHDDESRNGTVVRTRGDQMEAMVVGGEERDGC